MDRKQPPPPPPQMVLALIFAWLPANESSTPKCIFVTNFVLFSHSETTGAKSGH